MTRIQSLLALFYISHVGSFALTQEVQFLRQPMQLHDESRQLIRFDFSFERAIRQQNQLVDATKKQMYRTQDRTLTVLNVHNGQPRRARVTYHQSSIEIHQAEHDPIETIQPVTGKTYFIELRGNKLVITDSQGHQPPADELEIVRLNLQTFGQPNPLAVYLHGKTVRVGQTLAVPPEVANELLGLTGNQGNTDQLNMKLVGTKNIDNNVCGVFETLLRTSNSEMSTMSLLMKGELTIEANSCRTRAIVLRGPVAISELRGPPEGRFTVSTNGTLQVTVKADYRVATRR